MKLDIPQVIGTLATLVRLHEGNNHAEINELLENSEQAIAEYSALISQRDALVEALKIVVRVLESAGEPYGNLDQQRAAIAACEATP